MKSVMMAAMVVQLTAAGGAGANSLRTSKQANEPKDVSSALADVSRHFSALKQERTTLQHDYQEAHERLRREAEQKKAEDEARLHAPAKREPARR